jgi:hypothetical protein
MRTLLLLCSLAGCRAGGAAVPQPAHHLTLRWFAGGLSPNFRQWVVTLAGDGHLAVQIAGMDLLGADGNMLPRTGEMWLDPAETAALFRRFVAAGGLTLRDDPPPPDAPGMSLEAVIGRDTVRASLGEGRAPAIDALAKELAARVTVSADAPPVEWPYAAAHNDCAPWDGAATSVVLSLTPETRGENQRPYMSLAVYHEMATIAGARWPVGGMKPDTGQPAWCPAAGDCVMATAGWVEFAPHTGDGPLAGRYDLTLSDGRRVTGRFSAAVSPRQMLCG